MNEKLSEFFIEKAKNELEITESIKEQSIKQFREWLNKHPFIKYPKIDEKIIIKYLRTNKYSMPKVFESFEKSLLYGRSFKSNMEISLTTEKKIREIYNTGAFLAMKQRDNSGAQIYIIKYKLFEDFKVSADEFLTFSTSFSMALENEEKNQISGVKCIMDCRDVSFNIFNILPLKTALHFIKNKKYIPLKIKQTYIIGLPAFAVSFVNSCKSLLNKKNQERVFLLNDENELLNYFEPNVLLEEFGGNLKIDECLEEFRKKFINGNNFMKEFNSKFEIDEEVYKKLRKENYNEGAEFVGSFRKLEID
ncbi:hypothetical protein PVAND_016638 [Polypedilum vanderplanki]|uniref:CRAL-TRIO domain-containing protein n=1 Tax=Polypedilum vanderplanki TaxID=319348 RepID=A0A9J6BG02_POLVA|nr:hypothetical protein PVAND_016638 [Polypedilum vanderplanki]